MTSNCTALFRFVLCQKWLVWKLGVEDPWIQYIVHRLCLRRLVLEDFGSEWADFIWSSPYSALFYVCAGEADISRSYISQTDSTGSVDPIGSQMNTVIRKIEALCSLSSLSKKAEVFVMNLVDLERSFMDSAQKLEQLHKKSMKSLQQRQSVEMELLMGKIQTVAPHDSQAYHDRVEILVRQHLAEIDALTVHRTHRFEQLKERHLTDFQSLAIDLNMLSQTLIKKSVSSNIGLVLPPLPCSILQQDHKIKSSYNSTQTNIVHTDFDKALQTFLEPIYNKKINTEELYGNSSSSSTVSTEYVGKNCEKTKTIEWLPHETLGNVKQLRTIISKNKQVNSSHIKFTYFSECLPSAPWSYISSRNSPLAPTQRHTMSAEEIENSFLNDQSKSHNDYLFENDVAKFFYFHSTTRIFLGSSLIQKVYFELSIVSGELEDILFDNVHAITKNTVGSENKYNTFPINYLPRNLPLTAYLANFKRKKMLIPTEFSYVSGPIGYNNPMNSLREHLTVGDAYKFLCTISELISDNCSKATLSTVKEEPKTVRLFYAPYAANRQSSEMKPFNSRHQANYTSSNELPSSFARQPSSMKALGSSLTALILAVPLSSNRGYYSNVFNRIDQYKIDFLFPSFQQQLDAILTCRDCEISFLKHKSREKNSTSLSSVTGCRLCGKRLFNVGDFFITKHSNTSYVQVLIHLIIQDFSEDLDEKKNDKVYFQEPLHRILKMCNSHSVRVLISPLLFLDCTLSQLSLPYLKIQKRIHSILRAFKNALTELAATEECKLNQLLFVVPETRTVKQRLHGLLGKNVTKENQVYDTSIENILTIASNFIKTSMACV